LPSELPSELVTLPEDSLKAIYFLWLSWSAAHAGSSPILAYQHRLLVPELPHDS
jgi:hypothetical protein